jgi:hypothetical protein
MLLAYYPIGSSLFDISQRFRMRERSRAFLYLVLSACSLVGCGRLMPIPDGPGERITESPAQAELLGTWKLTTESAKDLKREGFKGDLFSQSHSISLFADGKCEVSAYDNYCVSSTLPSYIASPGTWKTEVEKDPVRNVVLTIQWGDRNSGTNWGVFTMRVAKDAGRLVFWSFLTDPDARMYYEFAKDAPKKDI